jgi:hypothetical protein
VQPDGFVGLKGAGTLLLEGLTVPEMQQAVSGAYRSFLREPSPRPVFVARDARSIEKTYTNVMGWAPRECAPRGSDSHPRLGDLGSSAESSSRRLIHSPGGRLATNVSPPCRTIRTMPDLAPA